METDAVLTLAPRKPALREKRNAAQSGGVEAERRTLTRDRASQRRESPRWAGWHRTLADFNNLLGVIAVTDPILNRCRLAIRAARLPHV